MKHKIAAAAGALLAAVAVTATALPASASMNYDERNCSKGEWSRTYHGMPAKRLLRMMGGTGHVFAKNAYYVNVEYGGAKYGTGWCAFTIDRSNLRVVHRVHVA
jgi:hypothetical protein